MTCCFLSMTKLQLIPLGLTIRIFNFMAWLLIYKYA